MLSIPRGTLAAGLLGLALPVVAAAQQPAPRAVELPRADATRIINLRRVLDLTPRQLTQLDSIERVQVAQRRAFAEQMRARRDSMAPQAGGRAIMPGNAAGGERRMLRDSVVRMTPEQRAGLRDSVRARAQSRMAEMQPQMQQMRQRDSVSRAAAERVLNDAQRQRLREIQAEERGRQRGLREARMQGGRPGMGGRRMIRGGGPAGAGAPGGRAGMVRERMMIQGGRVRVIQEPGAAPRDGAAPREGAVRRRPEI